jgi:hypothetical protein
MPGPCDLESWDVAFVSSRRLLIIQPPVSQSAASWQQNIPRREAAIRKYLPIFDSYLDSIIANSSPEIATAIYKTISWPSLENRRQNGRLLSVVSLAIGMRYMPSNILISSHFCQI